MASLRGLTSPQNSSGGESSLGAITKRGDRYLRALLVQEAKAAVLTGKHKLDPISQRADALKPRSGWQKSVVAMARKNVRISWALVVHERYDSAHIRSLPIQAAPAAAA